VKAIELVSDGDTDAEMLDGDDEDDEGMILDDEDGDEGGGFGFDDSDGSFLRSRLKRKALISRRRRKADIF
jgi:hypothetical protein